MSQRRGGSKLAAIKGRDNLVNREKNADLVVESYKREFYVIVSMAFRCSNCDKWLNEQMLIPYELDSLILYRCPSCQEYIKETRI